MNNQELKEILIGQWKFAADHLDDPRMIYGSDMFNHWDGWLDCLAHVMGIVSISTVDDPDLISFKELG